MKNDNLTSLNKLNEEKIFYTGIIVFAIIKFLLVNQLPMLVRLYAAHDDLLMLQLGESLRNFHWLGDYHDRTLMKGIMEPLFVAVNSKVGMSFSNALILLYIFSCLIFCKAISYSIKSKLSIFFLYIILLFNPASMDLQSYQWIYRCTLTPAQVLLVFGSFWGLYFSLLNYNEKVLHWSILSGLSLFFFWNTREDSIWILPFVLVITIIMIVNFVLSQKNQFNKKNIIKNIAIIILPLAILKFGNLCISAMNYCYYGIFTTTETAGGNFPKAMKYLYAVKPEKKAPYTTVTREKLNRIYSISPSLNNIKEHLELQMNSWDTRYLTGDNEVADGWFVWAFRMAVHNAGYKGKSANEFYGNVANEIKSALNSGKLERQKTMPSALMSPWREEYKNELPKAIKESIKLLFTFKKTEAEAVVTQIKNRNEMERLQLFKKMTYSPIYIKGNDYETAIAGWAFSKISDKPLKVDIIKNDGRVIKALELLPSQDVYNHAKQNLGLDYNSTNNCRFSSSVSGKDVIIRIYDDFGNEVKTNETEVSAQNNAIEYYIDNFNVSEAFSEELPLSKINRVNKIVKVYQKFNTLFAIFAIISLCGLIVILIHNIIKKNANIKEILNKCLVTLSLLATLSVLIAGVSYTHISSFPAIRPLYYSGAYSLILAFEFLAIYFFYRTSCLQIGVMIKVFTLHFQFLIATLHHTLSTQLQKFAIL